MQIPRDQIIIGAIALGIILLVAGGFVVQFVMLYSNKKKADKKEKEVLRLQFSEQLLRSQLEVQEHTLKTIAADIHDNVGQILSISKLTISSMDIRNQPAKAEQKKAEVQKLIEKSLVELKNLAGILYAENILSEGLDKAVAKELSTLAKAEVMEVKLKVSGARARELGHQRELIGFRILQELLSNAINHADASQLTVELVYTNQGLELSVSDNGRGFQQEEAGAGKGLGIGNFNRRAAMIQGSFQLQSNPGSGTKAQLFIPYNNL